MKHRGPGPNRIILSMDSHALAYAQSCKKKFWLGHVEHLHSRKKKDAYELGTFIHDCVYRVNRIQLRSRKGTVPFKYPVTDDVILKLGMKRISRSKLFPTPEDKVFQSVKWAEFLAVRKSKYDWLKPLGAEVGFSKVIYEDNDVCFIYEGRIDFVARIEPANILTWVDYKTQSKEYVLYHNPNQFLGYSWVLGTNLGFVQYYGFQKGAKSAGPAEQEKERLKAFKLESINHPPELINQWKAETIKTFRSVASLLPFGELAFERTRAACTSGFSGTCQFVKLCDNAWAPPEVLVGLKKLHFKVEQWHPWREKEKNND